MKNWRKMKIWRTLFFAQLILYIQCPIVLCWVLSLDSWLHFGGRMRSCRGRMRSCRGSRRLYDELTSRVYGSRSLREQEWFLRSKQEEVEKWRAMFAKEAELGVMASRRLKTLIEAWVCVILFLHNVSLFHAAYPMHRLQYWFDILIFIWVTPVGLGMYVVLQVH